ncbi:hypothetical protein OG689_06390 [Kitasatospora sp. NBC_00240]|uniref:hypothetical protein n=1 Tax=Kitasatospora sp. NBC_00240 TaxID=2903567 RepID=UPI00225BE9E1|nr:hypothetical protein [Kitasatospora sp. NBC_00240]MCX5208920.1 hypothetical protein [Kitasatospora sp. NBC_00240]
MRLRNAAIAAASAVTLVLAVPGSATASFGEFRYTYRDAGGERTGRLVGPPSGACVNLAEATREEPARTPKNRTGATATVFPGPDCAGDGSYLLRPGFVAPEGAAVRSVVFS